MLKGKSVIVIFFLCIALLAEPLLFPYIRSSIVLGQTSTPVPCGVPGSSNGFNYIDFSSPSNLCFVGNAGAVLVGSSNVLRLTPSAGFQVGAAWYTTKQTLNLGFQTIFTFKIKPPTLGGPRADGIAFVIQSQVNNSMGPLGCNIGYTGITKSLAIEFDTYTNNDTCSNDPNNNHISIHSKGAQGNTAVQGASTHVGMAPDSPSIDWDILENGVDIADDQFHEARIIYAPNVNGSGLNGTGTLRVFVDDFPVLSKSVNLTDILDAEGKAWVGFTGSTASEIEANDIYSWRFVKATQVTDAADNPANPAIGSLRQRILTASSWDLITFAPGVNTIDLYGLISINEDITIDAGGLHVQKTSGSAGEHFGLTVRCNTAGGFNCLQQDLRAFWIQANRKVYIGGMVFSGFNPYAGGAVISNQGILVLSHVIMQQNRANYNGDPVPQTVGHGSGGAIYHSGAMLVIDSSTLRGNTADCDGGAIYNTSHMIIKSSTFNGNIANQLVYQGSTAVCRSYTRGGARSRITQGERS